MDTNSKSSLELEIHVLELEARIEGSRHRKKQIQIEKMKITARISELEEAMIGIDANIAEMEQELADYKTAHSL
jgi:hypothetical protein